MAKFLFYYIIYVLMWFFFFQYLIIKRDEVTSGILGKYEKLIMDSRLSIDLLSLYIMTLNVK